MGSWAQKNASNNHLLRFPKEKKPLEKVIVQEAAEAKPGKKKGR